MEKNQENQINYFNAFSSIDLCSPNKDCPFNQTPLPNKEMKCNFQNSPFGKNLFADYCTPQKPELTNFGFLCQSGETPLRFCGDTNGINFPFTLGFSGSNPEYINSKMQIVPKNLMADFSPFRRAMNNNNAIGNSYRKSSFDKG